MRFAGSEGAIASLFGDIGSPNYGQQAQVGQQGRGLEKRSSLESQAMAQEAANFGKAKVAAAEAQADSIEAQGAAAGQASMVSGIAGGIGSLAGGFGSMMGQSGGVTPSSFAGSVGSTARSTARNVTSNIPSLGSFNFGR